MRIIISPRAEKELKKLSKVSQIIIAKKIRTLTSPQIKNRELLRGYKNVERVRVGDYRIVYKKTTNLIYIILIGHSKDIYNKLKKLLG